VPFASSPGVITNDQDFIDEVARRAGFSRSEEAREATMAVLATLGERLVPDERRAVALALPETLAEPLLAAQTSADFDPDELYRRVAEREGTPIGFAVEHTQAVLETLGATLPLATRVRLERHLGPALAALFVPRANPRPPPAPVHLPPPDEPGDGTTLSSGRLGSYNPISEAKR
jgi:uncharacterized protein (DUF2267 family)